MSSSNSYIYGKQPLLEQLKGEPEKVEKIFLRENLRNTDIQEVMALASQNRIPVSFVPGKKLLDLVGKVNDQGVVALVAPVSYLELHDWLEGLEAGADTAILLLDEIEDPHNFGAILRSATAAGMTAVLVPKHRRAPVNATVFKTSAGTAGRIPIVRAGNLNQAIIQLKKHKFWVAGLDQNAECNLWEMDATTPMAFVIGSEERGIRRKTGEHCDLHYSIPMTNDVESLNASVSAALVCYEWRRQRERIKTGE